ncbi:hypothetical protein M1N53_01595 [Thermodesulfovibrionales bacterium]|nr:hypothetical protein [Thermodesulfovibrionales bacterium]
MGDSHLYRAIRYTENNPLRVKKAKDAWEYEWSSAKDHAGCRNSKPLIKIGKYETIEEKG